MQELYSRTFDLKRDVSLNRQFSIFTKLISGTFMQKRKRNILRKSVRNVRNEKVNVLDVTLVVLFGYLRRYIPYESIEGYRVLCVEFEIVCE